MSDKKSDTDWWGEHYRINAQWLIIKLNALVNADLNELELKEIKSIVRASLPNFAESYGVELQTYREGGKND
jgi:hypothetical protein